MSEGAAPDVFTERLAELAALPEPTAADLATVHLCPECEAEPVDEPGDFCDSCTDDLSDELADEVVQ